MSLCAFKDALAANPDLILRIVCSRDIEQGAAIVNHDPLRKQIEPHPLCAIVPIFAVFTTLLHQATPPIV